MPIFVDNLFRLITLTTSYYLISQISHEMVAVMGITKLYIVLGFVTVESFAQGSAIIINQLLGANRTMKESYFVMVWSNILFGLVVSMIIFTTSPHLLRFFNFPEPLIEQGVTYLKIVGSGFCVYSANYALLSILNGNGLTRISMTYSIFVNGSILLTLYLFFLLPHLFSKNIIIAIALTNLIARLLGMVFLVWKIGRSVPDFSFYVKVSIHQFKSLYLRFLKLNLASICEPIFYQFFQLTLAKIVSMITLEALSLRAYLVLVTTFLDTPSLSIARAHQIIVGHLVGANKIRLARAQLKRSVVFSLISTSLGAVALLFLQAPLFGVLPQHLLVIVAGLCFIRACTFNIAGGLKASGDVIYCLSMVVIGLWAFVVPGSYLFVHYLNIGVTGIWTLLVAEEAIRALFLLRRWNTTTHRLNKQASGPIEAS